ncbi:MAG: YicC/YloC family endoribonuclease [Eubacteriales bacterium]
MTGFGRGEYRDENIEIIIEMKSINHRYKDLLIRLPKQISMLEENIRKFLNDRIIRGRVELSLRMNQYHVPDKTIFINDHLAQQYIVCLQELKNKFPMVTGETSLSLMTRYPDIISSQEEQLDMDILWLKIEPALREATESIIKSRDIEGQTLLKDFKKRLNYIEDYLKLINEQAPKVTLEYRRKLEERMKEYTGSIELDENRLLTEVAYFCERINITEEITRLYSHVERFFSILEEREPVGRKLDFLLQEMNREVNTIGSKANNIIISNFVVDIKSELEKMREQIQNIE